MDEIETLLHDAEEREISTSRVGGLVMERLRELDKVAYVRFASVYRKFEDVDEFLRELKNLIGRAETKVSSSKASFDWPVTPCASTARSSSSRGSRAS